MYVLAIHIPIYTRGTDTLIDINWQRDVLLARDWLAAPFGPLVLVSPSMPLDAGGGEAMQLVPVGQGDGVRVVPSFDRRCRAREFWVRQRRQWVADIERELTGAVVLHTSASDVFRPLWYLAHRAGVRRGVTTVLVGPDMDPHLTRAPGVRGRLTCAAFDHLMHRAARSADLVLLKEGAVHRRYGGTTENVRAFCHSMFREAQVISAGRLESRLATLGTGRPLRAVYAGRFVARKGMLDAVDAIGAARASGTDVEFHLFGSGPEEDAMRRRAHERGVPDLLRFHGFVEYTPEFIAALADFDVLLFTPTEEDTPRMLYDAMAAGLALVGTRIPFLEHRVRSDAMGELVEVGHGGEAGRALDRLRRNPARLEELSRASLAAGRRHSIEQWYRRRADWTAEAVAAHRGRKG